MKRYLPWALLLGLLLAVLGCSDATDSNLQEGDLNDPEFLQVQPQFETAIAQAVGSIDQAMDFSFVPPSDTIVPARRTGTGISAQAAVDTFSYSYDPVTGWHVAYAVFSDSGVTGIIRDSVQFRDAAAGIMQDYDELTTDQIRAVQHLAVSTDDTLLFAGDFAGDFDLFLSGLTGAVVTVDGDVALDFALVMADDSSTCELGFGFAQTVEAVTFVKPADAEEGVCPTGGSMVLSGTVSLACTGTSGQTAYSESWTVQVTFHDDGTMDVEAQSGNTLWTYTGEAPCGNYESPL